MAGTNLKGRVAVVTGASMGIGRATAIALAQAGASVVVNYRSHDDEAESVVQAIRASGGKAVRHQADVADQSAVEGIVRRGVEEFGRVDIAVSNAVYSDRERFYEADMS